jgi:hypothetical protein
MKSILTLIFASMMTLASFGQDVIEITFDSFDEDPLYTPADTTISRRTGETIITPANWLVKLEHDTYRFSFNFYGEDLVGTYSFTEGDFLEDYTYGYDKQTTPYATGIDFESCELTITETRPSATITRYHLEANIVDTNDKHYLVKATHDILTATEVVEAEILDAQITPTEYGFVLTAKDTDEDLDIQLAIEWNFGITGSFTSKLVNQELTAITHNDTTFNPQELEMTITFAENLSTGKPGYIIPSLQFLSPDVVAYNLHLEAPIIAIDTVEVTCFNLAWDESQKSESAIMFEASNGTYAVFGMLSAASITAGEYIGEKASLELTEIATGASITPLTSTLTVAGNKLKGFTVAAEVLGTDHKVYNLDLSLQNETPSNVDNVEVKKEIQKMIVNGQLIIMKDGAKYNSMGQMIK